MAAMWKHGVLVSAFATILACPAGDAAATPFAHLILHSEPGDFIGLGLDFDVTYSPPPGFLSPSVRRTVGAPPEPAELLFVLDAGPGPDTFALVFFGTDALGVPIAPGHYDDAQRADFAAPGHPGLDISFQHRGCNQVAGSFDITQAVFSDAAAAATGSPIDRFSASFVQHCEGFAPALTGSFTYSAFGAAVPEPATWLLLMAPLAVLLRQARRAS